MTDGLASIEDLKLRLARLGVTLEESSPSRRHPPPPLDVNLSPGARLAAARSPFKSPGGGRSKSPFASKSPRQIAAVKDEVQDILDRCEKLEDQLHHGGRAGDLSPDGGDVDLGARPFAGYEHRYHSPVSYRPYTAPLRSAVKKSPGAKRPARASKGGAGGGARVQDVATAAAAAVHTAAAAARAHRMYGVTGRLKEEEMAWAQERVALRRELTATKKRAVAAEGKLKKIEAVHATTVAENKELRAALRGRDRALLACERRLDELEGLRGRVHEESAARVAKAEGERDSLKAMMGVTLHRLERVERVAMEMERKGGVMNDHMRSMESDHYLAIEAAKSARMVMQAGEQLGERTEAVTDWHNQVMSRLNRLQQAMVARVDP